MDKERAKQRLKEYQQSPDLECKRKHEAARIQLRKEQRSKRFAVRHLYVSPEALSPAMQRALPALLQTALSVSEKCLLVLAFLLKCNPPDLVFEAIQYLRKMCSHEEVLQREKLGSRLVQAGIADLLHSLLSSTHSGILIEALWCLINLTCESHEVTMALGRRETLALVVELLSYSELEVVGNSIHAIGNFAADCLELNSYLNSIGALARVLEVAYRYKQYPFQTQAILAWTLGRLFASRNAIRKDIINDSAHLLVDMAKTGQQNLLLACLSALADISLINSGAAAFLQGQAMPFFLSLTTNSNATVVAYAVTIIGNVIANCNDHDTDTLLASDLLPSLRPLTVRPSNDIRKNLVWIVSNLLAGTREHKIAVLQDSLIYFVLSSAESGDSKVALEVSYCLYNALRGNGGTEVAALLAELGALECIKHLISSTSDPEILLHCMKSLDCILLIGLKPGGSNPMAVKWEEIGGLSELEDLQHHSKEEIYEEAVRLMAAHYGLIDTDKETQELPPPAHFVFS